MEDQRREVRHLEAQDQVQTTLKLTWEVESVSDADGDGMVTLQVRPVPCGPRCGIDCECSGAMFAGSGPFHLRINGRKRLPFLGNLGRLLKDYEAMQARIARLQGAPAPASHETFEQAAATNAGRLA